jgi:hypothetical protein
MHTATKPAVGAGQESLPPAPRRPVHTHDTWPRHAWPVLMPSDGGGARAEPTARVLRHQAMVGLPQPILWDPVPDTMNSLLPGTGAMAPKRPKDSFWTPEVK